MDDPLLCSIKICRHYIISLPPNLPTFGGKLAHDGGKSSVYTGEGNGLHRAQKVLTSAAGRPYIFDKRRLGRGNESALLPTESNSLLEWNRSAA
jgi:hypothetical protein